MFYFVIFKIVTRLGQDKTFYMYFIFKFVKQLFLVFLGILLASVFSKYFFLVFYLLSTLC